MSAIFTSDFKAKNYRDTNYWRGTGALCFSKESNLFFVSTPLKNGHETFTLTLDNAIYCSSEYLVNLVLKILETDINQLNFKSFIRVFICSYMLSQVNFNEINLKKNVKFIES